METKTEVNRKFSINKSQPVLVQPETKSHDEYYYISNLDRLLPIMIPTVYCFKSKEEEKSSKNVGSVIKEALSKVLVHYYPLAGSLMVGDDEKFIVKCTNKGVPFVEAEADCELHVLGDITIPDPSILNDLVYTVSGGKSILETPLLAVQVTRFKCGGFVLGMVISHVMADGIAAMEFVNSWTEITRGVPLTTPPYLDRHVLASRKPPLVKYTPDPYLEIDDISGIANLFEKEKIVIESFTFDEEKINTLKEIVMHDGAIKSCTSFSVFTALIWRSRCKALKMKPGQKAKLYFAVDGRSKLDPPLPKGYFGNGMIITCCICPAGELMEKPLSFAVEVVQNCTKMVTGDYIRSSIDYLELNKEARLCFTTTLLVSSWTRLSFHTADFGWGEPDQTGCVTFPDKELALFLPVGKNVRKGITVLLGLPDTAMKIFKELFQV